MIISDDFRNKNKAIQIICIKGLYEIVYIKPELIADYVTTFVDLLSSRNNRLVWRGMIALSTIGGISNKEVLRYRDTIKKTIENGSVITVDAGQKAISNVAGSGAEHNSDLFHNLIESIENCRPKSIALYSECISGAVTETNRDQFVKAVQARIEEWLCGIS